MPYWGFAPIASRLQLPTGSLRTGSSHTACSHAPALPRSRAPALPRSRASALEKRGTPVRKHDAECTSEARTTPSLGLTSEISLVQVHGCHGLHHVAPVLGQTIPWIQQLRVFAFGNKKTVRHEHVTPAAISKLEGPVGQLLQSFRGTTRDGRCQDDCTKTKTTRAFICHRGQDQTQYDTIICESVSECILTCAWFVIASCPPEN